jgi:hypothetical protein
MASQSGTHDRVLGVWGARAYQWSGEERPRAAGFRIDPSGRQRVLGFPADPPDAGQHGWFHKRARPASGEQEPARRRRLIVAVVAILPGEPKPGWGGDARARSQES